MKFQPTPPISSRSRPFLIILKITLPPNYCPFRFKIAEKNELDTRHRCCNFVWNEYPERPFRSTKQINQDVVIYRRISGQGSPRIPHPSAPLIFLQGRCFSSFRPLWNAKCVCSWCYSLQSGSKITLNAIVIERNGVSAEVTYRKGSGVYYCSGILWFKQRREY